MLTHHSKILFILLPTLLLNSFAIAQTYSLEMVDSTFKVLSSNGVSSEIISEMKVNKTNGSGEIFLAGNFPEIALNNLQIGYLGGNELGLDGDIVPFSSVTFDLGNSVSDEHWDQVVANTFVTYTPPENQIANIKFFTNALKKILNLKPQQYQFKSGGHHSLGFSIQELEKHLPEVLIKEDYDYNPKDKKLKSTITETGINYNAFIPILIQAIKEQQQQIDLLRQQLDQSDKDK